MNSVSTAAGLARGVHNPAGSNLIQEDRKPKDSSMLAAA
jgi:hypothetical protein